MTDSEQNKWNSRYSNGNTTIPGAADVLLENHYLLPAIGRALDLACGRGGNAFCLAENGLDTVAWDISDVVITQLNQLSNEHHITLLAEARDVSRQPPEANSFDVIVVSRFLDRALFPALKDAVTPGGLIFYQTFIKDKVSASGPNNPDYLLDENELLSYFQDWTIRVYREEGSIGNASAGFRNQAALVAQKPKV